MIEDRTDNKDKQERRPPVSLCEAAISGDTQRLHSATNTPHFVISTQNEIKQQDGSVQQFNHTERDKKTVCCERITLRNRCMTFLFTSVPFFAVNAQLISFLFFLNWFKFPVGIFFLIF